MKIFRKIGLALAACLFATGAIAYTAPSGFSINPLTPLTQPGLSLDDVFNQLIFSINTQTVGISTQYPGTMSEPVAGVDTSPAIFSTTPQQNPLQMTTFQDITAASANAGQVLLSGQSGRVIKMVGAPMVMVSGTAAGATSVQIMCTTGSGNGKLLATYPIAMLTTLVPVFYSGGGSAVVLGSAASRGCSSGEGVYVSNNGTLTTTTDIYVSFPYTVQ